MTIYINQNKSKQLTSNLNKVITHRNVTQMVWKVKEINISVLIFEIVMSNIKIYMENIKSKRTNMAFNLLWCHDI